jgi:hypothetical protein
MKLAIAILSLVASTEAFLPSSMARSSPMARAMVANPVEQTVSQSWIFFRLSSSFRSYFLLFRQTNELTIFFHCTTHLIGKVFLLHRPWKFG